MTRVLILACGNPLRSDDGAAPEIVKRLQDGAGEPKAEILCAHQWTPEMAENISQSDLVIFVDASAVIPAGEIQVRAISAREERLGATTHACGPERLLALAQTLYGKVPGRAFLLTIGGQSFEHGERLSEVVQQAVPKACEEIRRLLSQATPVNSR